MSAPLSNQLFHGSSQPFNKGDLIKPMEMDHAFATKDKQYADNHSVLDAERDWKAGPKSLFTYLYKVSPVDAHEMHSETEEWRGDKVKRVQPKKDLDNILVSKKGFRVEGLETMHPHPQIVTDNKILENVMRSERRMRGKGKS